MAKHTPVKDEDAPPLETQAAAAATATAMDTLAAAIAKGITDSAAQTGPIKQVPITRYRNRNVYNPSGDPKRPQFTREYWQNGKLIEHNTTYNEEVLLLNQIQPGRYINRLVEVIARDGETGAPPQIEIRYPHASADDRFNNKNYFRTFRELLELIVAEQRDGPEARAS